MSKNHNKIIPVPAVNAVIFNDKKQVLITRRSPIIREPGKWCLPGGHFDGGEDWVSAMRREVKEEVGLDVTSEVLLGIYSDPSLTVTEEPLDHGNRAQFLVVTFLVTQFTGEVAPNDEVDKWDWFDEKNLPGPMVRSHPVRVEDAYRYEGAPFIR